MEAHLLDPTEFKPPFRIAQCYKKMEVYDKAANFFKLAIDAVKKYDPRISNKITQHMLNLGVLYFHNLNKADEALEQVNEVEKHEGMSNSMMLLLKARILERLKRYDEAI